MYKIVFAWQTLIRLQDFLLISASGIHFISGGHPPMSHRVFALNSFVLPAQMWIVFSLCDGVIALMDASLTNPGSFCQSANLQFVYHFLLSGRLQGWPSYIIHHLFRVTLYSFCQYGVEIF